LTLLGGLWRAPFGLLVASRAPGISEPTAFGTRGLRFTSLGGSWAHPPPLPGLRGHVDSGGDLVVDVCVALGGRFEASRGLLGTALERKASWWPSELPYPTLVALALGTCRTENDGPTR